MNALSEKGTRNENDSNLSDRNLSKMMFKMRRPSEALLDMAVAGLINGAKASRILLKMSQMEFAVL